MKWLVVGLLLVHGLIHLLGPAKAFGFAEVPQLAENISRTWGIVWGVTAVLFFGATLGRAFGASWWWILAALAVIASQIAIVAFWSDAKFGTIANLLLVVPIVLGFGAWRFSGDVRQELAELRSRIADTPSTIVAPEDLEGLPSPVATWLAKAGVVGKPRDGTIRLTQEGTMQKSPEGKWMSFHAEQWFLVDDPAFLWVVSVDSGFGSSLAGRDMYLGGKGSMRIELQSLVPVVSASGSKIDQGTKLRFLAEMMWFPSAALRPYLRWEPIDDRSARATLLHGGGEVSGVFLFDSHGEVSGFEAKRYREDTLEEWIVNNDTASIEEFDGIRIPTRSTITWRSRDGDAWTWLRLRVKSLQRDVPIGP